MVDGLSHRQHITSITTSRTHLREYILQYLPGDAHYDWVRSSLDLDPLDLRFEDYSCDDNGLLRYYNKIYVSNCEGLQKAVLEEIHCTPFVGSPGVNKMMADLRPLYFWLGLK